MFFILSKIIGPLLQPIYHICGAAFLGWCLLFFKKYNASKWLLGYSILMLLLFGVLPLGYNALVYLESRNENTVLNEDSIPDGIIVMGGAMNELLTDQYGQAVMYDSSERMTMFLNLARRFEAKKTKLVFTGGSASLVKGNGRKPLGEAEAASMFVAEQNFPIQRIIFESQSRTTFENAKYTKELLQPKDGEQWVVVTSAFHMPRTMNVFKAQGWDIEPYATDYRTDSKYVFISLITVNVF